ncbi:efflux RND transporter permease subunit [Sedimentibacter hydroxybenzoicus DSM 7310]|uniref:Efflux RND transporter permease subunit n=1 Tax=Sedimentibacter hydroxybenzoicus DSM 7310 TaxID=1123245 RepID=A0A974GWM5_SEDHY|nr:efflux RND transporter permease subunit [Sedimentibacter hydroxybenzoicus]NYB74662.1 efflux RND transporter permease subunit [Sedimentibacter hydroxybenzoicus DSM 7310]
MFAKFSVKKPVTITMMILIVIVLGAVSLSKLQIDLLPQMELPYVMVQTSYSGAGPEEIENMITKPMEQTVATVENIEGIMSYSNEGSSIVLMQFAFGTDMDDVMLQLRENIDMIEGFLPEGTSAPLVMKLDPNAMPIIQMAVSSKGDIHTTQKIAEDVISPRLERIEGTASANVSGGLTQEVEIMLKEEVLKGYNLSSSYITQMLQAANINLPGGTVSKGSNELTVRTVGEFKSLDEIKNLSIPLTKGGTVRLMDIADVKIADKEQSSITKLDGKEVVQVSVMKQSDGNTVNVSKLVNKEIEKIKREYPDISIINVFDQAEFINFAINNLTKTALQGGILAIVILLIFLRSFKTTLVIALSIPTSIITTFVILYFADITLNMMTIGGLALGIGMLVDNSIVVLENIYRNRSLGIDRITASVDGTNEVAMAVTASTLTTVAVFIPIVFTGGLAATIFKDFALSIVIALFSSLLIALTLVPMLSSKLISVKNLESEELQEQKHGFLVAFYKKVLKFSLNHRFITLAISIALFVVSIVMVASVGAEFFPATDEGVINVSVSLPAGSETKEVDNVLKEVHEAIQEIPEVTSVFTSAGSGGIMSIGGGSTGSMSVILSDLSERDRNVKEVSDEIRKIAKDIPGAEISVSESSMMMMGMSGGAISISIKGDDIETLKSIGSDFKALIEKVEGTREVSTSYEDGIPQVQIVLDRGIASQYGLSTAQVGAAVKNTLSGSNVTKFKVDGNEVDVVLKGDNMYGQSMSLLEMLPIPTPMGSNIPLSEIADIKVEEGPVSIMRENQTRVLTVTGSVAGRDVQTVSTEIEKLLRDYTMPYGYSYTFGGETEQIVETFTDLAMVLLVAIVLVYMIIAAQFESLLQPLSIMFSVPLALSGGFIGLFITGLHLNVIGIIGLIILVGIVVNNAIVLVDYINNRRNRGEDRTSAIMKAGPIRIRPIMMTALTTILGLVPMALGIGEGAELTQSMGVVVIGGLALSTVLTLVVVPVMYTIFDDIADFFKRKFTKQNKVMPEKI